MTAGLCGVSRAEAIAFMLAHHYLGTVPSNATNLFGWRHDGRLLAVASYGACHVPKLSKTFRELQRLAASPAMQQPLSSFLSATVRDMRRFGAQALITWADPAAGHHGGIYQATNWVYCEPRSYNWNASYRTPDGTVLSHRQVFDLYGTSAKAKVLALHPDWEAFLPPMKHRYIYPLAMTKAACLEHMRARERPYPKPDRDGDRPKRPAFAMRAWPA
jgi:hypothetical protein